MLDEVEIDPDCLKELVAIGQYRQVVKLDGFWENGLVVTSDQAGWWPDA